MDAVQLPQGYSHFEEAVYFLPLSSQKFLVLKPGITSVKDKNKSANVLNDLSLISRWAYDWKMLFNPDPKKPAQEVYIFFEEKNYKPQQYPCGKEQLIKNT